MIIQCHCSREVDTSGFGDTFTCACGAMYNPFGQLVKSTLREIDEDYAGERW